MEFEYLMQGFRNAIKKPMDFTYTVDMDALFNRPTRSMVKSVDMEATWLLENADKILGLIRAFEIELDRMGASVEQRAQFDKEVEVARQKSREHRAQWRIIHKQIKYLNHRLDVIAHEYETHILIKR